jgi:hypothetical protein
MARAANFKILVSWRKSHASLQIWHRSCQARFSNARANQLARANRALYRPGGVPSVRRHIARSTCVTTLPPHLLHSHLASPSCLPRHIVSAHQRALILLHFVTLQLCRKCNKLIPIPVFRCFGVSSSSDGRCCCPWYILEIVLHSYFKIVECAARSKLLAQALADADGKTVALDIGAVSHAASHCPPSVVRRSHVAHHSLPVTPRRVS